MTGAAFGTVDVLRDTKMMVSQVKLFIILTHFVNITIINAILEICCNSESFEIFSYIWSILWSLSYTKKNLLVSGPVF